jgi:5'(3')-deoxyribonucleotidase
MNNSQKKPKNKIIGVTLDDVLRDFTDKFVEMYNETYPDQQIPEDQIKSISPYKINHFFNNEQERMNFYMKITLLIYMGLLMKKLMV